VCNITARIELVHGSLNFIELPTFGVNEGGDGFGGKKRFRSPSTFRERLKALLGVRNRCERIALWSSAGSYVNLYTSSTPTNRPRGTARADDQAGLVSDSNQRDVSQLQSVSAELRTEMCPSACVRAVS
jgi:hypothetical protein